MLRVDFVHRNFMYREGNSHFGKKLLSSRGGGGQENPVAMELFIQHALKIPSIKILGPVAPYLQDLFYDVPNAAIASIFMGDVLGYGLYLGHCILGTTGQAHYF